MMSGLSDNMYNEILRAIEESSKEFSKKLDEVDTRIKNYTVIRKVGDDQKREIGECRQENTRIKEELFRFKIQQNFQNLLTKEKTGCLSKFKSFNFVVKSDKIKSKKFKNNSVNKNKHKFSLESNIKKVNSQVFKKDFLIRSQLVNFKQINRVTVNCKKEYFSNDLNLENFVQNGCNKLIFTKRFVQSYVFKEHIQAKVKNKISQKDRKYFKLKLRIAELSKQILEKYDETVVVTDKQNLGIEAELNLNDSSILSVDLKNKSINNSFNGNDLIKISDCKEKSTSSEKLINLDKIIKNKNSVNLWAEFFDRNFERNSYTLFNKYNDKIVGSMTQTRISCTVYTYQGIGNTHCDTAAGYPIQFTEGGISRATYATNHFTGSQTNNNMHKIFYSHPSNYKNFHRKHHRIKFKHKNSTQILNSDQQNTHAIPFQKGNKIKINNKISEIKKEIDENNKNKNKLININFQKRFSVKYKQKISKKQSDNKSRFMKNSNCQSIKCKMKNKVSYKSGLRSTRCCSNKRNRGKFKKKLRFDRKIKARFKTTKFLNKNKGVKFKKDRFSKVSRLCSIRKKYYRKIKIEKSLSLSYKGPYYIVNAYPKDYFELKNCKTGKTVKVNRTLMKRYYKLSV